MKRRAFLLSAGGLGLAGLSWRYWPEDGWVNECKTGMPKDLKQHPLIVKAIEGLDFTQIWDNHVHLVGLEGQGQDVWVNPEMETWHHPLKYIQLKFYLDGSCVKMNGSSNTAYVNRLNELVNELPAGMKTMLLAFDYYHEEGGSISKEKSTIYTSNEYVTQVVANNPERFEWVASIHPYRKDSVSRLEQAARQGARAIKWLPEAMGIDPASKQCIPFYDAMQRLGIPLLSHAGHETAVGTEGGRELSNPLLLRHPMDHGVKVIMAHCASLGKAVDIDKGSKAAERSCFDLFERMMGEPAYEKLLFGDVSAILQLNRLSGPVKKLLLKTEWYTRLINGSDYPLPGIYPLFPLKQIERLGLIDNNQTEVLRQVRHYNPVWFDFLLKRMIRWKGQSFDNSVFETKRHFLQR